MGLCGSRAGAAYDSNGIISAPGPALTLRRPSTRYALLQQGHEEGVLDVCHAGAAYPDLFYSCGEDRRILLHDYSSGEILQSWEGAHDGSINRMTYCSERSMLVSASRDKSIKLWKRGASDPAAKLVGHDLTVSAVSATADGTRLASGSRDTTVRLWDLETGKQMFRGHKPQNLVTCLKWYPPGTDASAGQNIIIQGAEDLRVRVWDTRVGIKEVQVLEGYVYFPLDLDVSPCGRYVLTSSKGFNGVGCEARLWDLRGGSGGGAGSNSHLAADDFRSNANLVRQYNGHVQDTTACAFTPAPIPTHSGPRNAFVTASKDGSMRVWDRDSGEVLHEHVDVGYGAFTSMAFLPPAPGPVPSSSSGSASGTGSGNRRTISSKLQRTASTFVASTYGGGLQVYSIGSGGAFTCLARTPTQEGEGGSTATRTTDTHVITGAGVAGAHGVVV